MSSAAAQPRDIAEDLADFTATRRLLVISGFAIVIGSVSAYVALGLLTLIGFFTNLFFFQRLSTALVTPEGHTLGLWVILVPVAGALVIGVMARYGSERIRGHGIPEAIEAILINGSRIDPKVALLKPLSSAISIGSGGPFGAEGPIIMMGGAIGSLIAQFCHLTSAERKTLLVAGAAAGMAATFAAPLAAVLLAVELLLFEWKPRSLIPVALASATAAAMRRYIIGLGPLFPVPDESGCSAHTFSCRFGRNVGREHRMRERVSMDRDAVESMQGNLNRAEPAIVASYALIGAIMLLGGAGWAADRCFGTGPWCLLAGLIAGLGIGFYRLARVFRG